MFRTGLEPGGGMFFIFSDDTYRSFWMRNVIFPIDIIFLDKDFTVRTIHHSAKPCYELPCELYRSGEKVRYALEVRAGFCKKNGVKRLSRVEYIK